MNRPIFIIVIGYIIGILWGLYLQLSIVPFYFLLLAIYIIIRLSYHKKKFKIFSIKRYFRYIKLIFKVDIILTIIISSFISNIIVKFSENKYENLYKGIENLEITAVVVSNKKEKEYYNRYKIKIIEGKFKNTNLYVNVSKNKELRYGNKVEILNNDGRRVVYGHLKEFYVKPGDEVTKDTVIGITGCSGGSRVPHLHIEIRKENTENTGLDYTIDPLTVLPKRDLSKLTKEFEQEPYASLWRIMASNSPWDFTPEDIPYKDDKNLIS